MSLHISANQGEIASVVLMPGDPLRAKYMAEKYLEEIKPVNTTRNMLMFTGRYKGTKISIGASGMGCPSIGIYSFELYKEYNVECIIRVGTCGAYQPEIRVFDLVNATTAYSESTYARFAFGFEEDHIEAQGRTAQTIRKTADQMQVKVMDAPIHSADAFYRTVEGLPAIVEKYKLPVVEMESFALFANARVLKKSAGCLLTVSDNIITKQVISAEEREKSLDQMAVLALESGVSFMVSQ
jgi:purine-nucleoside phosphorylase